MRRGARCGTHEVGGTRPNAWGLVDMLGNVAEWVWDRQEVPGWKRAVDPLGPPRGGVLRDQRGGSWDGFWRDVRCARRIGAFPDSRSSTRGLRIARTVQ